jgi:hypothetical protein
MTGSRLIQLDDSFTKPATKNKAIMAGTKEKREIWLKEIKEKQEEENKRWFNAVEHLKFYLPFDNVILLSFKSIGTGKNSRHYFCIYYATSGMDTYQVKEIEYKDLADNQSDIMKKVGYFYQKYLKNC